MNVQDLIKLAENRVRYLEQARQSAWDSGDASGVAAADDQLAETQQTLTSLRSLQE